MDMPIWVKINELKDKLSKRKRDYHRIESNMRKSPIAGLVGEAALPKVQADIDRLEERIRILRTKPAGDIYVYGVSDVE